MSNYHGNGSCFNTSLDGGDYVTIETLINRTTSVEEYWENYVLGHVGSSWDNYVSFNIN